MLHKSRSGKKCGRRQIGEGLAKTPAQICQAAIHSPHQRAAINRYLQTGEARFANRRLQREQSVRPNLFYGTQRQNVQEIGR